MNRVLSYVFFCMMGLVMLAGCDMFGRKPPLIMQPVDASYQERLAAREIRRYVYQRTGTMLEIITEHPDIPVNRDLIVVADNTHPMVARAARIGGFSTLLPVLDPGHCLLSTVAEKKRTVLLITGGDQTGVLYGAYRLARYLGVQFSLSGDIMPVEKSTFEMPKLNEDHRPQFALRGILPFHGFPEGPDWWSIEDYKAILSQFPKLGMNFIGFHCSPEGQAGPEPSVWIGRPEDIGSDGKVTEGYPAHWFNTELGIHGYVPTPTSDYLFGADCLFAHDDYGPEVMTGFIPEPSGDTELADVFNRSGSFLREAFAYADRLDIATCIGTETPLQVPAGVLERIAPNGPDSELSSTLYEGMFERIKRTHDLDYYWLWIPENRDNTAGAMTRAIDDLETAIEAAHSVDVPFTLATTGWGLGSQSELAHLDSTLPREMPLGSINRNRGFSAVDKAFGSLNRRPTWVIPWVEDDRNLTMPQLWVGRIRADAAAAKQYRSEGLIGIHWRTRATEPTMNAFAEAAWQQDLFKPQPPVFGPIGENVGESTTRYNATGRAIAKTENDPVYQTVRAEVNGYRIEVPNGFYRVILQFCETVYDTPGRRKFNINLQDSPVLTDLDIAAEVGKLSALDYTFERIPVTNGILTIQFERIEGAPVISGIVIESEAFSKKINCGGEAYKDYDADWERAQSRDLATDDFYHDWVVSQFGPEAAEDISKLFAAVDGRLPRPSRWDTGPGSLFPDPRPWGEVSRAYDFVSSFERLRPSITGAGNRARFDYWLHSFIYMQASAQLNCIWGEFEAAMQKVDSVTQQSEKASLAHETVIPIYRKMVIMAGEVSDNLLATVSSPGELGTVTNFQSHILPRLLGKSGDRLADVLGEALPANFEPEHTYNGDPRLIVPTVRTNLDGDEPLSLTAIVLDDHDAASVTLSWRVMGEELFTTIPFKHVARGVYNMELPAADMNGQDIEYMITAITVDGGELVFPADGAALPQSVVVMSE